MFYKIKKYEHMLTMSNLALYILLASVLILAICIYYNKSKSEDFSRHKAKYTHSYYDQGGWLKDIDPFGYPASCCGWGYQQFLK